MATTGKKGKKAKRNKAVPLQEFVGNENTPLGITQVTKKITSWSDELNDDEIRLQAQTIQLPNAPRSKRICDDESVPDKPPFLAHISNIPFDVREEDIRNIFDGLTVLSLQLPKKDGEADRYRGYGTIEFATRNDLIQAVSMPDPQIKARRIYIDVSKDNDPQKRWGYGGKSRFDSVDNRDRNRDYWNKNDSAGREQRRAGYGYNKDRSSQEPVMWRNVERSGGGGGGSGGTGSGGFGGTGSGGFGEGGGYRNEKFGGRRNDDARDDEVVRERPKLILKPRTLALPELNPPPVQEPPKPKPAGVPAEKIFGSAKPVDTAAREKEIEERWERERLEKLKLAEEEKERDKIQQKESAEDDLKEDSTSIDDNEKEAKDARNTTHWKRRQEEEDKSHNERSNYRKPSPDRQNRPPLRRNDDKRNVNYRAPPRDGPDIRDNRSGQKDRRDFNRGNDRYKDNRERNDRPDRYNLDNRSYNNGRDNRPRDERIRRDSKPDKPEKAEKPDKPMPKYQPPQGPPALPNTNKFAMFNDEDNPE